MGKKINKKAKNMIIMSLMGTIFLILGTFVYLNAFSESNKGQSIINSGGNIFKTPQGVIALTIILLGIIAFLFVFFIKIIRGKNVSKLNEEYDLAFEEIREYIGVSALSFTEKRELVDEILSLFLEAQDKGKSVDEIIGKDHRMFIDDMIRAYGVKNYFIYDLLTGLQYFIFYLVAVSLLLFVEGSEDYFNVNIDYTLILFFIISAFIVIPMINRNKRKSISNGNRNNLSFLPVSIAITVGLLGGFMVLMRVLRKYFINISIVEVLLNDGIVIIRSPLTLIMMIISIPVIYFIKKTMRSIEK